eukprot:m.77152 g.77152  ORF g.77152 m.77152 type:complete len:372 (+) comp12606_c0_seq3:76-1191(+)
MSTLLLMSLAQLLAASDVTVPVVELHNAAVKGSKMPAIGLGTGGYGSGFAHTYSYQAVKDWLDVGGRRIDTALEYRDQVNISRAIRDSSVPREELFITSKLPNVGANVAATVDVILGQLNVSYVDLLLVHEAYNQCCDIHYSPTHENCTGPTPSNSSCRQITWGEMLKVYKAGKAKAIGVSNFESKHLADIVAMGLSQNEMPAVNQFEFSPYWHEDVWASRTEPAPSDPYEVCPLHPARGLVEYSRNLGMVVNGYSPLAGPDVAPERDGWVDNRTMLDEPILIEIGKHYNKSAAQIALRWEWQLGVVTNPRTHSREHMMENLNIFDFELSASDVYKISYEIPIPNRTSCPINQANKNYCCHKVCADPMAVY